MRGSAASSSRRLLQPRSRMKKAQELHVMPGTIGTRRSGGQLDFRPGLAAVAFPVVPTNSDFVHVDVPLPFPWAG
ncbi:hypothetical protein GU90_01040 [Saccharopolyspora rectivirgula]|uniref:Uncharacterized protein n=1 Tax=Saccharopolyspora rectivirgula TaxID=28042 RepID=A0A073B353_9PSEU|nr:hypothetical protein GU90_01040 [Saccharopolyspora rectivirgula]